MNKEIIQPWLPVSQKDTVNRRENKAQIPLIIHHMCIREKTFHNDISPHFKFLSNERFDLNKRSKGLTMQINFHSLLDQYCIYKRHTHTVYIYIHIIYIIYKYMNIINIFKKNM